MSATPEPTPSGSNDDMTGYRQPDDTTAPAGPGGPGGGRPDDAPQTTQPGAGYPGGGYPAANLAGTGANATTAANPGTPGTPDGLTNPASPTNPANPTDAATEPAELPDLPLEPATAFSVEGYEPDDPWNASLCVETDNSVTVLPLTPKTLGGLLAMLDEVDDAQRSALGVAPRDEAGDGDDPEDTEQRRRGQQLASTARVVTGSMPVARLWNASMRGRVIIVAGAALFILLGILFAAFT